MQLAVLFWCYKELDLCVDRVRHLRDQNPDTKIYALFGGDLALAGDFERALGPYIDDFYAFEGEEPPGSKHNQGYRGGVFWKYVHGDLMIADWYKDRGVTLPWDTIVIVQWDMLVYGRIPEVFSCLEKDQVLFSGLRPIKEVEDSWAWVAEPKSRVTYLHFLDHVREEFGYDQEPMCCVAVVVCLSRAFLDRYAHLENPQYGGLEYRMPIYAQIFGTPFCTDHPFTPWWGAVESFKVTHTLRARPIEILAPVVATNLMRKDGGRVFHPYWRKTPRGLLGWTWALLDAGPRVVMSTLSRRFRGNKLLDLGPPPS